MLWNLSHIMVNDINVASKKITMKVIFLKPYQRGGTATSLPACTEIANADKLVNVSEVFLVNCIYP